MLKIILIVLLVAIVGLVIVVSMQPADFAITRTATIHAPPQVVHDQVNDLHHWQAWSPWEKLDPEMKKTFEGPPAGANASYAWAGNSKAGEGKMTITESRPGELVRIKLEFIKPFAATNMTDFTFTPEGAGTKVTWKMYGKNGFMGKAFGLFMNMDKMVGDDFEKGLAALKSVSEAAAPKP